MLMSESKNSALVFLVLTLLALTAGGLFLFKERAQSAERSMADAAAEEAVARMERERAAARETPKSGAFTTSAQAALAELSRLGFPVQAAGQDQAFVFGRVVSQKPQQKEGATENDGEMIPVAGASLEVSRVGSDGIVDSTPSTTAAARGDGWFLVTVPQGYALKVRAKAASHLDREIDVAKAALGEGIHAVGDIVLLRAATVHVSVTAGAKDIQEPIEPVVGMRFDVKRADGTPIGAGQTAADGKLTLGNLPREELRFQGTLPRYGSVDETVAVTTDGQEIAFNVQLVGRLKLRCMKPAGGIATTFQVATDFQHNTYGYLPPVFSDQESKDPEGWVTLEGLKAGTQTVYATAAGCALAQQEVEIVAGETATLEIKLPEGHPLEGRVVTKGEEKPVENAVVYSETDLIPSSVETNERNAYRPMARATKTDRTGRFRLESLTVGQHRIAAVHPEHADAVLLSVAVGKSPPEEEVVLRMPVGATLRGTVFSANGEPVEDQTVLIINHLQDRSLTMKKAPRMTSTGAEGNYRIDHIQAGMRLIILQRSGKLADGEPPMEMKQQTFVDGVEVEMNFGERGKGAMVTGLITRSDGTLATDVQVTLMRNENVTGGPPLFYVGTVDAKGEYVIRNVKPGPYFIQIAKSAKGSDFAGREAVVVEPGATLRKDIVLSGGRLEGRVLVKGARTPIKIGEVVILGGLNDSEFIGRAELDIGGEFSFLDVPMGEYAVHVSGQNFARERVAGVKIESGRTTRMADVELEGGGRIQGLVLDAAGQPVGEADIVMADATTGKTTPAWSFGSQADGSFIVDYVPAGRYAVTATKQGQTFTPTVVEVTVGGAPSVTIRGN